MSFLYDGRISVEVLLQAKRSMTLEERNEMDMKIMEYMEGLSGLRMYSSSGVYSTGGSGADQVHLLEIGYLINYCKRLDKTKLAGSLK